MTKEHECWFIFYDDQLLLEKIDDCFSIPLAARCCCWLGDLNFLFELGQLNEFTCYVKELVESPDLPDGYTWVSLRSALELIDIQWFGIITRAMQIIKWDKNHQFCGRCGRTTEVNAADFERTCVPCQQTFYPRISPSIIVAIRKQNQLLLARKAEFKPGVYGLIAGFVESGETLEQTVHREVYEEVGITVKNICYFGSQPWPFPDSLMIGFTADYAGGQIELLDGELQHADWFGLDNMPKPSSTISIASKLIDYTIKQIVE